MSNCDTITRPNTIWKRSSTWYTFQKFYLFINNLHIDILRLFYVVNDQLDVQE